MSYIAKLWCRSTRARVFLRPLEGVYIEDGNEMFNTISTLVLRMRVKLPGELLSLFLH